MISSYNGYCNMTIWKIQRKTECRYTKQGRTIRRTKPINEKSWQDEVWCYSTAIRPTIGDIYKITRVWEKTINPIMLRWLLS